MRSPESLPEKVLRFQVLLSEWEQHTRRIIPWLRHERRECHLKASWFSYDIQLIEQTSPYLKPKLVWCPSKLVWYWCSCGPRHFYPWCRLSSVVAITGVSCIGSTASLSFLLRSAMITQPPWVFSVALSSNGPHSSILILSWSAHCLVTLFIPMTSFVALRMTP